MSTQMHCDAYLAVGDGKADAAGTDAILARAIDRDLASAGRASYERFALAYHGGRMSVANK
jgi:hypothetical protein